MQIPSQPEHGTNHQTGAGRRIALILLSAAVILIVVEAALQIRSHVLSGRSIFNYLTQRTPYVMDERTGLKLLRPNQVFADGKFEMHTNSLGLRSPEILPARAAGSLRIAVVGASTVMGLETAGNENTFPALLASKLRKAFPDRTIEVINAGIAGYTLREERLILERLILPLKPDLVVAYTGVNDFRSYCEDSGLPAKSGATPQRHGLPILNMPTWLISVRATARVNEILGIGPSRAAILRDPYSIDRQSYRARLEALATTVINSNTALVIATNTKAYRPEQSADEQQRLAYTERYFLLPCFDVEGLNALHDLHNDEIRDMGLRRGIPILPLDTAIPGGDRYFAGSIHFSRAGEQLVADEIFSFLMAQYLIKF